MQNERNSRKLNSWLILFAGADPRIVNHLPGTIEHQKIMIGLLVLATAVLATFTGGYAIYYVTQNLWVTIPIALLYGTLIFIFDNLMLSLYKKKKHRWEEILQFVPRLLLAIMIGLVIATPASLNIFQDEVEDKLKEEGALNEAIARDTIMNRSKLEIARVEVEIEELKTEEKKLGKEIDQLTKEMLLETSGSDGRRRGQGPAYEINFLAREGKRARLNHVTKELTEKDVQRTSLIETRNNAIAELKGEHEKKDYGLLESIEALHQLGVVMLFIKLLVILLETGPVVMKMLSGSSIYDDIKELEEDEYMAKRKHEVRMAAIERINALNTKRPSSNNESVFPPFHFN